MRKLLLFLLLSASLPSFGQTFKPFKVNVNLGYAKILQKGVAGGFVFGIEPKYGLTDNFDVGLRLESAILARGVISGANNETFTGNATGMNSAFVTGNFLVGKGGIRPFVGAGVGLFFLAETDTFTATDGQGNDQDVKINSSTKLGGLLRAGIKAGHFVLAVEYNVVPKSEVSLSTSSIDSKNSYIGFKVGFDFGGGRR